MYASRRTYGVAKFVFTLEKNYFLQKTWNGSPVQMQNYSDVWTSWLCKIRDWTKFRHISRNTIILRKMRLDFAQLQILHSYNVVHQSYILR
jgi:hypothetical protein